MNHTHKRKRISTIMDGEAVWETEDGTWIKVAVRPGSRTKSFVAEMTEARIVINLKSQAREGKANAELIKRLAKTLDISTGDLTIVSGIRSREKTFLVRGLSRNEVLERLRSSNTK
ncbi:MAG: DUF167 domain-containing protein [Candidatus Thorarchaeota archaeon]